MSAKNIREITLSDGATLQDRGHVMMVVNGQPVYASPPAEGPISEEELLQLAEFVTTRKDVAEAWMDRENPRLGNLTPRQAVGAGRGQDAANILRSFIAL